MLQSEGSDIPHFPPSVKRSNQTTLTYRNVLRKHGLPDDFNFYKYLRYNLQEQVLRAVELGWRVWVSILIIVVGALIIYYATNE